MARSGGRGRRVSTRAWAIHPAYFICCCTVFEACLCMSAICHAFHPGGWEWARACGIFCALRPVGLRQQSRAYWCQIRCCCGYTRCGNDYFRYLPADGMHRVRSAWPGAWTMHRMWRQGRYNDMCTVLHIRTYHGQRTMPTTRMRWNS